MIGMEAPAGLLKRFDEVFQIATENLGNPDLVEAIAVSVKEMLSNVREHQYHLDPERVIYITFDVTRSNVIVTIEDYGEPWRRNGWYFDPLAEKHLHDLMMSNAERGRGHSIIFLLTDSFEFRKEGRQRVLAWQRNRQAR